MKITIVNGNDFTEDNNIYNESLNRLVSQLRTDHEVDVFDQSDPDNFSLNYCSGCWDCWVKTPGKCRHKDKGNIYLHSLANTDVFLIFSTINAGFISAFAKKSLDRYIPNALPYIRIYQGECHHIHRYKPYKYFGIIAFEPDLHQASIQLLQEYGQRLQKNVRADKTLFTGINLSDMEATINAFINS